MNLVAKDNEAQVAFATAREYREVLRDPRISLTVGAIVNYRDDLVAAQARADGAEARAVAAERRAEQLQKVVDARPGEHPIVPVKQPKHLAVHRTAHKLVIEWRWWNALQAFLLVFALFWNGIMIAIVVGGGNVPVVLFFTHIPVGIGVLWAALAGAANRTTITAGDGKLSIHHRPVPWRRNHDIAQRDILQIFVKEAGYKVNSQSRWHVYAELAGGRQLKLLGGLDDLQVAKYLEQAFEEELGIANRQVAGEVSKS